MAGRKKKKSPMLSDEQLKRLERLKVKQSIYRQRGHDITPVDAEIKELEKIQDGGLQKPSEVK